MNFFIYKLINKKRYSFIAFITIFLIGSIFGFIEYNYCNNDIITFFQTLFYVEQNQMKYRTYLYQNVFYIFISTYLNSSYIGFFGISFLLFLKGVQFAFSFVNMISFQFSSGVILIIILEVMIELLFILILFVPNFQLSLQNILVSFLSKDNYNYKNVLNYNLNTIIVSIVVFIMSLFVRLYLINYI